MSEKVRIIGIRLMRISDYLNKDISWDYLIRDCSRFEEYDDRKYVLWEDPKTKVRVRLIECTFTGKIEIGCWEK